MTCVDTRVKLYTSGIWWDAPWAQWGTGDVVRMSLQEAYELPKDARSRELKFAAYSVLDATGTFELFETLSRLANPAQLKTARWGQAQLSPAVAMALRGIRTNPDSWSRAGQAMRAELSAFERALAAHPLVAEYWDRMTTRVGKCAEAPAKSKTKRHQWGRARKGEPKLEPAQQTCSYCSLPRLVLADFNPASDRDLGYLLYDRVGLAPQFNQEGNRTLDADAIERLIRDPLAGFMTKGGQTSRNRRRVEGAEEFLRQLLGYRDFAKANQFFNATLSSDGRFHCNFNVNAPWTGRWSSSKDSFRRGGNAQNITERHRYVFEPDIGYKMFYADLKTAESMVVAYLAGDEAYMEAHKQDVHTYVCRLVWPDLPWTGDIRRDKKIAQSMRPPWDDVEGHDYRFQAKAIQHGSNFGMSPTAIAIQKHVPLKRAQEAQEAYFRAFPSVRGWQLDQKAKVEAQVPIRNPFGREVNLLGRPLDGHTFKQALAFPPQSCVGEVLNIGLWRLWRNCDPDLVQCLAQVHDAVLGQFPESLEMGAKPAILRHMRVPFEVTDYKGVTRTCEIPVELATGYNWGKASESNPCGMRE